MVHDLGRSPSGRTASAELAPFLSHRNFAHPRALYRRNCRLAFEGRYVLV
jgi:hypothetical protein